MGLADRIARAGGDFIAPASKPSADRVTELEARVAALETALRQSQSQSHPRETKPRKSQSQSSGQKPWEEAGISKASWYRRKKEQTNA